MIARHHKAIYDSVLLELYFWGIEWWLDAGSGPRAGGQCHGGSMMNHKTSNKGTLGSPW